MIALAAAPFVPSEYHVKYATESWERREAAALRRAVFCREQGLFAGDDRDGVDRVATTIVALSMLAVTADAVVGTVRIHEDSPGVWWGSRLAVDRGHRRVGALGTALIRLAVSSARGRGCTRFLAHVQSSNVALFEHLHWRTLAVLDLHGRRHHRMEADLDFYPPCAAPEAGFLALRKAA